MPLIGNFNTNNSDNKNEQKNKAVEYDPCKDVDHKVNKFGVTYHKLSDISKMYGEDNTQFSCLSSNQMDANFNFLHGDDIKSGEFNKEEQTLILDRHFSGKDMAKYAKTHPEIGPVKISTKGILDGTEFNSETGVLTIKFNGESISIPGFGSGGGGDLEKRVAELEDCLYSADIVDDEFIYSLFLEKLQEVFVSTIGDGDVVAVIGEGKYRIGEEVEIGVEVSGGSVFVKWTDGVTEQYRTITVMDDESANTYIAEVVKQSEVGEVIPHVVDGQEEMGHVDGGGVGVIGDTVLVNARRYGNSRFKQWLNESGEVISTKNPCEITITSDIINVYAEFEDYSNDTILCTLNEFPYRSRYQTHWSGSFSNIVFTTDGVQNSRDTEFTHVEPYNNMRGWRDEIDLTTFEPIHYKNLLYSVDGGENIVFVLCGYRSSNWGDYKKDALFTINGYGGIDTLRFNYGYAYIERNENTNAMLDMHLVVKIYSGNEINEENLVSVFKITREFNEWGLASEEEKILNRPFMFDSMNEYDYKRKSIGELLNIQGPYIIAIRNYFSQTDLIKSSGETGEEYYGDDVFDEYVKTDEDGRIVVKPISRVAIDNIEIGVDYKTEMEE